MSTLTRSLVLSALLLAIFPARAEPLQEAIAAIERKDFLTAVRLLQNLAQAGNAQAQLRLGQLYYHGHGVRESNADAYLWFDRAARQGLAEAQFQLGNMFAFGTATAAPDTDPNRLAAQWYFEAARQGHADAQYSLGILFLTGSGVLANRDEAERWIERAAAAGHADAQAYLKGRPPR